MLFRMEGRWRGKCDDCGRIAARSNDEKMLLLAELKGQGWRSYASALTPDAGASAARARFAAGSSPGEGAQCGSVKYRLACSGCVKDWAQNTERLL